MDAELRLTRADAGMAREGLSREALGSLLRSIAMALLSLLFNGGIAYVANREHGTQAALAAFGAQALVSAINTFVATMIMERLVRIPTGTWKAYGLATLGGSLWAAGLTLVVHWQAHTPNFLPTIIPVVWMGTGYCAFYSIALVRLVHRKSE